MTSDNHPAPRVFTQRALSRVGLSQGVKTSNSAGPKVGEPGRDPVERRSDAEHPWFQYAG